MSRTVFDLEGRVGLEDKNFLSKAKRVKQALMDLRKTSQKVSSGGANLRKTTKEYQTLEKEIKQAEKTLNDLNKTRDRQAAQHKRSDEYKAMQKDIAAAEAELNRLVEEQISLSEFPHNPYFQRLDEQIETARAKVEEMKAGLKAMAETGATEEEAQDWYRTADAIEKAEQDLARYKAQQAGMIKDGTAYEQSTKRSFGRSARDFGWAKMKGLGATLRGLITPQKRVSNGFKEISKQAKKVKKGLYMGAGIKGLARLGVAGAIALYSIRALKQGLENLRAYDATTNASINQMSASLATLKNALATAFAPILNVVAPILATFIDWLTAAVTAIAHFMAALTGQSQVTIARKAIGGVSSGASDAAGSLGDASDAAKEYQRTLMGFDQINKLDDPTSGSGSGGSGGGGGGGAGGAGSMFETVPIDSTMANWADKIKEAWAKADFTEIGAMVAEKLNNALENIPWEKIQNTCNKIAKSVGTFINGFVETFDWALLAKSISYGIETAAGMVSTFLETVHWQSIGKAIVDFISGIDYAGLFKSGARLAGNIAGAIGGVIAGAVEEGVSKIGDYFTGKIEEAGGNVVLGILKGISDAITGIGTFIRENIFQPFIDGFKAAFGINSPSTVMAEQGRYIIAGLLQGLENKIGDVLSWFADLPDKIKQKIGDITVNVVGKLGDFAGKAVDMVANFTSWTKSFAVDTIGGWVAKFTSKVVDTAKVVGDTVSGWIAKFSKKVTDIGPDTISGWIAKFTKKIVDVGAGTLGGFTAKITKAVNGLSKKAKKLGGFTAVITSIINKAKKKLTGKAGGGVYKHGRWQPVQAAASGGAFSQGQVFVAREAGPEMVGTINGSTAVMNNDQIVASVSAGVARAVASVLGGQSSETRVYLEGDAAKLFRVIQQAAIDFTRSTGQPAFPV